MIDLCPRCRIQAPHRPGREHCPRCGGLLRVLDSELLGASSAPPVPRDAAPVRDDVARPVGPPQRPMPPPSGPRSGRLYRSRHVRWVARRPPEAIPARRRTGAGEGPRPIPRYVYVPRWGLRDAPVPADVTESRGETLMAALVRALQLLAAALGVAALAHLARYILLVVNRSMPVPAWSDWLTSTLVIFGGLLSFGFFVYTSVVFARWVIDLRRDAYARHDRRDPRPRWQIAILAAVPLVNVAGVGLLLHEVAMLRDDLEAERTRRRLTRVWVAWTLVNAIAILAVVTRIVARFSGSIQTGANGLAAVTFSALCSAVFAWWFAERLTATFGSADEEPVPSRRWVAVA